MFRAIIRPQSVACLTLALAASLLWGGHPAASTASAAISTPVPLTLGGGWQGQSVPLDRKVFDILETNDVTAVEYHRQPGELVWLAQVAGFGNRAAFHPPEICFVGSHFEVLERGPMTLSIAGQPRRVMRLVIGQEGQRFEAWYWFTANGRVTPSYYQQQWWLLTDAIRRRPISGTLVRISTTLDDSVATHERLAAVMAQFEQAQRAAQ